MKIADKLQFIIKQNEKNKLSHAFLIETNNIKECFNDIKEIIKVINKTKESENLNKLIDLNNLPSLAIIEPDGMNIKKSQLEELEQKFSTKPVYSKYNNYIILNADKMNNSSANTLLKFLEEPEDDIIGFLLVTNKENVLPTIKSRCEIAHVDYNISKEIDQDKKELVDLYIDKIYNTNDYLINKNVILSKYTERADIEELLLIMHDYFFNKYKENINDNNIRCKYDNILEIIQSKLDKLRQNGNLELLLDSLVIEMRRSND